MAGNESNAVILAALNQSIKAINDLAVIVGALSLSCPEVTVNLPAPIVNCYCSGVASGGSTLESSPGDQGQTPPSGYVEPDPNTTDRKCKVANMIHDSMVDLVDRLAVLDADQYAALGYTVTLGLVGAALGSVLPPVGTVIGAVGGVIVGIGTQLITGGAALDLSDLSIILSTNQESLVNGLYNATSAESARSAYSMLLAGYGASAVEGAIISYALNNDLVNLLFFTREDIEADIADYVGEIDCMAEAVYEWHFDSGAEGWILSYAYGAEFEVSHGWGESAPAPDPNDSSDGILRIEINKTTITPGCAPWWTLDIEEMGIVAHTGDTLAFDGWYTSADHSGGSVRILYTDDTYDNTDYPNFTGASWQQLTTTVTSANDGKTIKSLEITLGTGEQTGTWVYGFDRVLLVIA